MDEEMTGLIGLMKWMDEKGFAPDDPRRNIVYDKYMDGRARNTGTPVSGIFELTPLCNLDCKMCYVHLTFEQMKGKRLLSAEEWIDLIDQAVDCGMLSAEVTGGEAMMHPEFDRIYLHLLERGVRVALMTNGILLTEKRIEFLKRYRPASIQVTLYGGSEDVYERVTGKRVYKQVTEQIIKAKEIGCRLVLTATPSRYFGKEDLKQVIAFAEAQKLKLIVNKDLNIPREDTGRKLEEFDLTGQEQLEILALLRRKDAGEATGSQERRLHDLPETGTNREPQYGLGCAAGRSLFCINWKGQMKACLDLPEYEEPRKIGLKNAWERIHRLAESYEVPRECAGCAYRKVCNPCPVLHGMYAPKGHADRRICERTRRLAELGVITLETEN